jgi:non-homologous end joining protein Ku
MRPVGWFVLRGCVWRPPQLEGLKLSLVSCSISLYPATSSGERVSFNQINKNTGNRIRYKKVDG